MTKIIDCTIRDGGHVNNWDFSYECVKESYTAALKSGIDYFEAGYRNKIQNKRGSEFLHCDDELLFKLFGTNPECEISVMADSGKAQSSDFQECKPDLTPVSVVRIATYPQNLKLAFELCEDLKQKGYKVFLNLMAISDFTEKDFNTLKNWNNKSVLEAVCFADSFGSFFPYDVEKIYKKLKNQGFQNIGFHSHNNLQLAFANSLRAIELGAYSVDGTIFGMGRGGGNLPVELICAYMYKTGTKKYNPASYFDIIEKYYLKADNKYKWGYCLPSLLSGFLNIHPDYVAKLNTENLSINEIWKILEKDKKYIPLNYNNEILDKIIKNKI